MPDIDNYKGDDGEIDWDAWGKAQTRYKQEQIEAGERCYQCETYLVFGPGHRKLCHACKDLNEGTGEVDHDHLVRCPHCGYQLDISQLDCDYHELVYEEGTHEMDCFECEKSFEFTTNVSYSYTSPPLEKKGDDDADATPSE
jgi:hypothetical protein